MNQIFAIESDSLGNGARQRGVHFGAAISTWSLAVPACVRSITRDCTLITAEYQMKWDAVVSGGWEPADEIVAFAEGNGLAIHGHALWWHESVPPSYAGAEPPIFTDAALRHLDEAVRRYAGRIGTWDVVNEPLDLRYGRADGLRDSPFLKGIGPDYIGLAYRAAAAADPSALLVLNEMAIEDGSREAEHKRRALLRLLERERARGTPIHALGIQSHLDAAWQPRTNPSLRAFLREVAEMGLAVLITELDVADHACPRDHGERDRAVADVYRAYLDLVLDEAQVLAVTTWGLSDSHTWLSGFRPRPDGAAVRPLPLDRAFRRKPAWHAIAAALARE